ncbi:MAG: hypothetical protein NZ872_05710 [Archaeoglobaceae archaeon]|nr:hypothetical protein [Archaeoglobaceae archaeon]MDW8128694.1 hypothetical protein [Archaeoglobaceae archaeon]
MIKMKATWLIIGLALLLLIPSAVGAMPERGEGKNWNYSNNGEWREKIFKENKERMMNWVEKCERWMERMQEKVNTSNLGEEQKLRIQDRVRNMEVKMEQIKSQISNANNYEDLRKAMKETGKLWINMSKEMRLVAYEHAITQTEKVIERLEELADRFESYGLDTTKLRNAIEDANSTLLRIKEKLANGEDVFKDLRELKKKIDLAFSEAKKLAREYKPKPSNGLVNAKVNGTFTLSGTINALIKGTGNIEVNPESAVTNANATAVAIVVKGNATVEGDGKFKIIAHGNGTLVMDGEGSYAYKECVNDKFTTGSFEDSVTIEFGCEK